MSVYNGTNHTGVGLGRARWMAAMKATARPELVTDYNVRQIVLCELARPRWQLGRVIYRSARQPPECVAYVLETLVDEGLVERDLVYDTDGEQCMVAAYRLAKKGATP